LDQHFDTLNMSNGTSTPAEPKPTPPAAEKPPGATSPAGSLPPLFRPVDWLTFFIAFAVVWLVYFFTLAPELTLEDSGELCTGSFYAGIPHPPGYPFWAIYSWIWTKILPWGNVAWRVEVGEATAAALACGLVGIMVSRGSSMLMEGIEELKGITGKWEAAICSVSGIVTGTMLGLGGVMWSESVAINRISLFGVPWVMIVAVCLMHWIYAPHQRRYLYCGMFFFGVCATIHQTLLVAAIGVEVAIIATQPRLGRDLLLGNSLMYILGLAGKSMHAIRLLESSMLFTIFNLVGIASIIACIYLISKTKKLGTEWLVVLIMAALWAAGASFYFYEAIAGMTNPPMEWGYPRTVEGFFHALSRGQYEQANPIDVIGNPSQFITELRILLGDVREEFNLIAGFLALTPLFFFFKMQKRERAWIAAVTSLYLCIGVLLVIIMSPTADRQSAELIKVFFTSSHGVLAIMIGYGIALTAAYMAAHYQRFRFWGLGGGCLAVVLGLYALVDTVGKHYFGYEGQIESLSQLPHLIAQAFVKGQYGLPIYGSLILLALPVIFVLSLVVYRNRAPLAITLVLFLGMPVYSGLCHWGTSEQRNHWFGYWFGHDMFTPPFKGQDGKPLFPEMTKDAILFGGTDPGRFCPTYMIFCESFTPHKCQPAFDQKFDRRDVYIITQNALADGTYLCYLRAQYNRSKQIDPPFFSELARFVLKDKEYQTNLLAHVVSPLDTVFEKRGANIEKRWRTYTSWFAPEDFTGLGSLAAKLRPGGNQDALSQWLYQNLSKDTQGLLAGGDSPQLRKALAADLNVLLERELKTKKDGLITDPLYVPARFAGVKLSAYVQDFISQNPQSDTRIRLNRLLLEEAYPGEIARSNSGVYPDKEIYIPSPEDSQQCFSDYMQDAQRRMQLNQLDPGESVQVVDGRLSVSGNVAVMAINGLLTKVIFDHNPDHEYFLEESFPLKWMYPYLTPYGIIMKINNQPVPEITEDMVRRDHEFWKQYSKRLAGDFIDYDTSVKDICDYVEKIYIRHDFSGFTGDTRFARDDQAQKAFSKLRSSIAASVYTWRIENCSAKFAAFQQKSPAEQQAQQDEVQRISQEQRRMFREAEYAYKQAFVYCPFSPEAVFHFISLLAQPQVGRYDDALLIAKTALKLDPENGSLAGLVKQLSGMHGAPQPLTTAKPADGLQQMESQYAAHPEDFQNAFALSASYFQVGQTNRAIELLRQVMNHPKADGGTMFIVAQAFAQIRDFADLELSLEKLTVVSPDSPESWYNLAALKSLLNKKTESLNALGKALALGRQKQAQEPKYSNLLATAIQDVRFDPIRSTPEFKQLTRTN
jgi:tetratricopeptide (TPR) repeat protein